MKTPVGVLLRNKGNDIVSVGTTATVFDAVKLMAEKGVGALLVLNKSGGLSGILSERDCFNKVLLQEKAPRKVLAKDIMTRKVSVVPPERTIEECMALMIDKHIRHLPVVKGEKILGVLSMRDAVTFVVQEQDLMIKNLEKYIEGSF
jgi:CBS domain-containing protein